MNIYTYQQLQGNFTDNVGVSHPDWMFLQPKHTERYEQIQQYYGNNKSTSSDDWHKDDIIELGLNPKLSRNFRDRPFELTGTADTVLKLISQREQRIVFVSLMDCWGFEYNSKGVDYHIVEDIYDVCDHYNIDYDKVAICTGNATLEAECIRIANKVNKPVLKNFYYNTYYLRIPMEPREINLPLVKSKFLFTNRRHTDARFEILHYLHRNDMLKDTIWSYNNVMEQTTAAPMAKDMSDFLRGRNSTSMIFENLDAYNVDKLVKMMPKGLDRGLNFPADFQDSLPNAFYDKAGVYIIQETNFEPYSELLDGYPTFLNGWHSEKTLKTFLKRMPAIVFAAPNHLANLKTVGYRTFNDMIDESYDSEIESNIRFSKAANELNRIHHMSYNELHDALERLRPVLEHNYNTYMQYSNIDYYKNKVHTIFNIDITT